LYLENAHADSVYVLYHGSASLKKNIIANQIKPDLEKMKMINLLFVGEGAMLGLEAVTNKKLYQFSICCESEYTILFKITLSKMTEIDERLIPFLSEKYKEFKIKMKKQMENYEEYKPRNKINHHENNIDKQIRKNKYVEDNERKVEQHIKDTLDSIKGSQKNKYQNDFKNYEIIKKSLSYRFLMMNTKKTIQNASSKAKMAEKLRTKLFDLTKLEDRGTLNTINTSTSLKRIPSQHIKGKHHKKNDSKLRYETLNSESNRSIEKTTIASFGFKQKYLPTEGDSSRQMTNCDYTCSHDLLPNTTSRNDLTRAT
jgi:hypothetical protein